MTASDARSWLITAAPARSVSPKWRNPTPLEPVFPEPPSDWPTFSPMPAAEASIAALEAFSRPQPMGNAPRGLYDPPPGPATAAPDPMWDLTLVADTGPSMTPWHPTINAIAACAYDLPLFNSIQVEQLRYQRSAMRQGTSEAGIASLGLDQPAKCGRHRMILIITDGVGAAWQRCLLWDELRTWAGLHTVAILHVLPHYHWKLSGIPTRLVQLRAPHQGCPNAALETAPLSDLSDKSSPTTPQAREPGSALIPVLEIRKRWLDQWVRLQMTNLWVHQQALEIPACAGSEVSLPSPSPAGDQAPSADRRIADFQTAASEDSFNLAVLLAAAPLNHFVMQLIATELMPTADAADLSAILTSGLLVTVEQQAMGQDTPYGDVTFDFVPDVRQKLLALGESGKTRRVIALLDKYLANYVPALQGIDQRMRTPADSTPPPVTPQNLPYLRVECALLTALSGDSAPHRAAAEALRSQLAAYTDPPTGQTP